MHMLEGIKARVKDILYKKAVEIVDGPDRFDTAILMSVGIAMIGFPFIPSDSIVMTIVGIGVLALGGGAIAVTLTMLMPAHIVEAINAFTERLRGR